MKNSLLLICCLSISSFLIAQNNSQARLFMVQQDTSAVGDTFALRIYAANFNQLDSLSFSLYYKNDQMRWEAFTQPDASLADVNVTEQIAGANGKLLKINWKSIATQGLTTTDSVALLELYFVGLKPTIGGEYVAIVNYPVPIHAFNTNGASIQVSDSNLDLLKSIVIYPTEAIHFAIEDTAVAPGQSFCRKVQVISSDLPMLTMQFSLGWNPKIIHLDSMIHFNIPGLQLATDVNLAQREQGKFAIAWFDRGLQGANFPAGMVLFEGCFTALDTIGNSAILFTNDPTTIEFYGVDEKPLRFYGSAAKIGVTDDPFVRPGDTNLDGVVNHFDVLNIGLGYGNSGDNRRNASLAWKDQPTSDWAQASPISQVNYKHFDTDGNGLIELSDIQAIEVNWGRETQGITTEEPIQIRGEGAPLYVQTQPIFPNGDLVSFDIVLGEEDAKAQAVYGVAFSIVYDAMLNNNNIEIKFNSSWLGTPNEDLLVFQHNVPSEHRIDVALVRNDGQNRSGFGAIGQLEFLAPTYTGGNPPGSDTIATLPFQIENVRAIDAAEMEQPTTPMETMAVVDVSTGINNPAIVNKVNVFPNPVKEILHIHASDVIIEKVFLYDVNGRLMIQKSNANAIPVAGLPEGLYFCKIQTDKGLITKRIAVVK